MSPPLKISTMDLGLNSECDIEIKFVQLTSPKIPKATGSNSETI
jgi:hypothetical protein